MEKENTWKYKDILTVTKMKQKLETGKSQLLWLYSDMW